jgi:hypothetical protein
MPPTLTDEDYLRVQLATKRESFSHRTWDYQAVKAFASADVITGYVAQRDPKARTASHHLKKISARLRRLRSTAGATIQEASA